MKLVSSEFSVAHRISISGEVFMRLTLVFLVLAALWLPSAAQDRSDWLASLPKQKGYVQKCSSSYDRS
jgi:hypothetical protein